MPHHDNPRRPVPAGGFTLIELLTVIAVIGILASILVPVVSTVRTYEKKQRTVTLFNEIAGALESYKLKYGHYPMVAQQMTSLTAPDANGDVFFKLNDNTGFLFHVLTANFPKTDTTYAPYNPRRDPFLSVPDGMLVYSPSDTLHTNPLVGDAFGNTDIGVVVNITGNASVSTTSVNSAQSVTCAETGQSATPTLIGSENIPQSIVIFSYDNTLTPPFLTNFDYSTYATPQ